MTDATGEPAKTLGGWFDMTRVHPRRAFFLMALGGIVGLGFAGVALFQAKGTSTLIVPADAVAMVNQQPVSRIDFISQIAALGLDPAKATPQERHKVLDDMIREELFVQRGKELDVATVDPDVRGAMVRSVEAQAAANAITAAPSDKELRAFYDANRAKYAGEGMMVVRDLVFPAGAAAQARAALVAGGASDAVLARFGGTDTKKTNGEEFYFAAKIHLGDAVFDAAKRLNDGAVSQPLPAADGVHLLVMTRNSRPVPYTFDEARQQVLSDYQSAAINRFQEADSKFLRKRANVLIAKDLR